MEQKRKGSRREERGGIIAIWVTDKRKGDRRRKEGRKYSRNKELIHNMDRYPARARICTKRCEGEMRSSELDASLQYLRPEEGILWDRGRKEG